MRWKYRGWISKHFWDEVDVKWMDGWMMEGGGDLRLCKLVLEEGTGDAPPMECVALVWAGNALCKVWMRLVFDIKFALYNMSGIRIFGCCLPSSSTRIADGSNEVQPFHPGNIRERTDMPLLFWRDSHSSMIDQTFGCYLVGIHASTQA